MVRPYVARPPAPVAALVAFSRPRRQPTAELPRPDFPGGTGRRRGPEARVDAAGHCSLQRPGRDGRLPPRPCGRPDQDRGRAAVTTGQCHPGGDLLRTRAARRERGPGNVGDHRQPDGLTGHTARTASSSPRRRASVGVWRRARRWHVEVSCRSAPASARVPFRLRQRGEFPSDAAAAAPSRARASPSKRKIVHSDIGTAPRDR